MKIRSFLCHGIVLKRINFGETDRMITLLSKEIGLFTSVAKGVRRLNSTNRAHLEPGNYIKGFFINTKGLPLLTQVKCLDSSKLDTPSLKNYRQLSQILEILEKLFVEEELDEITFNQVLEIRKNVLNHQIAAKTIRSQLGELISRLGFQHPDDSKYDTISQYVAALSQKPIRSYEYLMVKS